MRIFGLAVALLAAFVHVQQAGAQANAQAQPVLVELFTSEGCSSCPPADALLARLDSTQFVPGAHAIVLSEHVTYWNYLGWRDPFSFDALSDRQQQYATRFGLAGVYTPQAVIDGSAEALGSDAAALNHAIADAAQARKPEMRIQSLRWQEDGLHFAVQASGEAHLVLMAALAEDTTQSSVARGENAGRVLHHVAVVRVLKEMGEGAADGRQLTLKFSRNDGPKGQGGVLRLVTFLIDQDTGKVKAAAETAVAAK